MKLIKSRIQKHIGKHSDWKFLSRSVCLLAFFINALCVLIWMEAICRNSISQSLVWILERTSYAALCLGLISLILSALIALLGRIAPAVAIGNVFFLFLSIIQRFKLDLRGDPFQFSDVFMAQEAFEVTGALLDGGMRLSREIITGLALMAVLAPLAFAGIEKLKKSRIRFLAALALCAACVPYLSLMASTEADDLIVTQDDYTKRGFLVAFADRLPCFDRSAEILAMPEHYTAQVVEGILTDHKSSAQIPNVLPNILFVMSESLYDIGQDFSLSEEPIPFFKQLQQEHYGGEFYTVTYGGGTANVEYEVLTGYRTADTPGYGFNVLGGTIRPGMKSIVSVLESYGYFTQAIHPNAGSFYDRQNVYEMMGFDSMLFTDSLDPVPESILLFPPDDYLFEQIIQAYETKPQGQPWFCHTVTYQNHAGYGFESDFTAIQVTEELEDSPYQNVFNFSNMLRLSDDALRDLIAYFEVAEEPIVIVVWGDHAPAFNQFGVDVPTDPAAQMHYYTTPLLVYSNYGAKTSGLPAQISGYRLGACILNMLGMESDAYFNYLGAADTPNLTLFGDLIAKDGGFVTDPVLYQEEQETLRLLHYDRLIGENYGESL